MHSTLNPTLLTAIPLLPLAAAMLAGLAGRSIGRAASAAATIAAVALACVLSCTVLWQLTAGHAASYDGTVYTWLVTDGVRMQVGFLVDHLTALMMVVVSFVSLCVHVYTIGYMHDDPGYQRFFAYISLFTFSMLMLVMSNNFMQLFFGWEAVGVVSYLLIGFWYTRPSAIFANLKAFLVNRVGDFGFLLGIAAVLYYTGSLDYQTVFAAAPAIAAKSVPFVSAQPGSAITLICVCLFIGAMGKSAQMPLHVWLPDSMEGPTPISALIHAATMVTAGIFMVARMSPLFELSQTALSLVLIIGATTALFMGLLGIINNDIKRVIAYSTLSQLGYMTAGLGASAYSVAIFHLMTHAFFKALLFLAAGAVIIAMHHEQDMRKMGGLRHRMPVTYWTAMIGSLALIGTPFFSGFFSKDALLDVIHASHHWGAGYAYFCVLAGLFITALYTFRMMFLTFHGEERMDHHTAEHFHDVGWDMKAPLVALAIPSVLIGWLTIDPLLFGGFFNGAIRVLPGQNGVAEMARTWSGATSFAFGAFRSLPVYIAAAGVATAWVFVLWRPLWGDAVRRRFAVVNIILDNKFYFDWINENVLAPLVRGVGYLLWRAGDQAIIDTTAVNGSADTIGWLAGVTRRIQSGFLYSYAFWMIIGLAALLGWFLSRLSAP
ncbi:MAG TPA: NADH-quinone oxidoreductase subunit L [Steroidobacteraceae bacterium]|nr:NADH-quinone oxidoreductase subunit L [Steroidobacteraceae bacterium]